MDVIAEKGTLTPLLSPLQPDNAIAIQETIIGTKSSRLELYIFDIIYILQKLIELERKFIQ
jgi:hypothetical protein